VRRTLSAVRHSLRAAVVATTALSALAASALAYGDGIDISHWQGTVDWTKVRSDDVTFAFMKATEGTNYTDPTLQRNWTGAENVGIYRAAYHFARPSTGSAVAQAKYFVAKTGSFQDRGDLPPVLDLEATGGLSPAALRSWVATWLSTVEGLTGRTPILYFSPSFWVTHMGNSTAFTRYPLWIAHYTTKAAPTVPGGWSTWTFWQRTSSGHVDGIAGNVDMNRFNGNAAALASLARTSTGSTGPVTPGPTLPVVEATTLTMTPGATAPAVDASVSFTGDLTRTTPVARLAARPVELWSRRSGGAWARSASGTTDGAGHYALTVKVPATSEYQARFPGDASYAPAVSAPVTLTTAAQSPASPAATRLDLRKDRVTVRKGAPLMLYGHLTTDAGAVAGQEVRYFKRAPAGGSWIYVGKSTSKAPTGWHSLVVRPRVTRVWKAVFTGSGRYQARTSAYLTVTPR
jgi:GH25 family lysozyme M1 (1,4-beta-N-acetylmuramidase)